MPYLLDKVWILPAIMAGSFLLILFFGKKLLARFGEKATASIGIASIAVCFILSLFIAGQWIQRVNHPPTGADMAAAEEACLGPSEVAAEEMGVEVYAPAEHGEASHGAETEGDHSTEADDGHGTSEPADGEATTSDEHGAAPMATGESAAAATPTAAAAEPAAEEGHEEVIPVCASMTWFESDHIDFEVGTVLDGLSAMMLFTVTMISLLVHLYSLEYLHKDVRFTHYYAFLSLFSASMLFYVLSSNTLQMLVGWELVGVCSFGLIGHWWEQRANPDAALTAFLTNRVGDTGLIIGVVVLFFATGAASFNVFFQNQQALSGELNTTLLLIAALALFWGVTSKSGQFPLHTWLPDAMAGPTPVSALIHAATMVVAGVYLIARMYGVFWGGLEIGDSSIHYVAFIGGFTTIIGGILAFVQQDLKKVLAYSTISQLGYMVMALGVGAWTAGVFHLFTHAFFKACLFLGAGSVSHACHHTFDMREMGGLRKYMPSTHKTFLIATIALAGIFPFAGFWSKDEILAGAANGQGDKAYTLMLVMGLITAFMTAAYMGRAYYKTFRGEYRGHGTPHESPKIITIPLWILAVFATVIGLVNFPGHIIGAVDDAGLAHRFEHYVQPTFAFPTDLEVAPFMYWLAGLSLVLAGFGLAIGIGYFAKGEPLKGMTERNPLARIGYVFLEKKYYLDALYESGIRDSFVMPLARAAYWFNMKVLDGIVNGLGVAARKFGTVLYRYVDQGVVDGAVNGTGLVSEESGQFLRRLQTGKVQQYGALLFGAAVILAAIFVLTNAINA
ncbi:MAG: NADH-quinone oxidoreductase subunit L [Acidimicrobiales bacterium]